MGAGSLGFNGWVDVQMNFLIRAVSKFAIKNILKLRENKKQILLLLGGEMGAGFTNRFHVGCFTNRGFDGQKTIFKSKGIQMVKMKLGCEL